MSKFCCKFGALLARLRCEHCADDTELYCIRCVENMIVCDDEELDLMCEECSVRVFCPTVNLRATIFNAGRGIFQELQKYTEGTDIKFRFDAVITFSKGDQS